MASETQTPSDPPADPRPAPLQFGLGAVLWTILVIGMALAYLKQFDSDIVFLTGVLVIVAASALGALIGCFTRRIVDATYWAVVMATAAYLSVAGERSYGPAFSYAWASVGMMAGACCGAIAPQRVVRRTVIGGVASGVTMLAFAPLIRAGTIELVFDIICAPIVGALVGLLIAILLWLERQSKVPRYVTASWLLFAVIIGNFMVPVVRA